MKLKGLLLLFIAAFSSLAQQSNKEILCPPVLIYQELGESSGAGFFARDSVKWYLVTARHLVVDIKSGKLMADKVSLMVFGADLSKDERCTMNLDLKMASDSGKIKYNVKDDVVAIEMGRVKNQKEFGFNTYASFKGAARGDVLRPVSISAAEEFKNVNWGDELMLYGFPTSLGLKPLPQYDYDKPLLRSGAVAGKYEDRHMLVADCQTFAGNAGGAVLKKMYDKDLKPKYLLVGVATDYIPYFDKRIDLNEGKRTEETIYQNNSGYTLIVPMDVVAELVRAKK